MCKYKSISNMYSNWDNNRMAMVGMRLNYRKEFPQGNSRSSEVSSSRGYSTTGSKGIFGSLMQKCVAFLNPWMQINTSETNKMPLTVPDICVDFNISAPIFEAIQGKAKLIIPEDEVICEESLSAPIKSCVSVQHLFDGNSDPSNSNNRCNMAKPKKRQDVVSPSKCHVNLDKNGYVQTRKVSPIRMYNRSKSCIKNRREKNYHVLQLNIKEDMWQMNDDQELCLDNKKCESNPNFRGSPLTSSNTKNSLIDLSETAFPSIAPSISEKVNFPEIVSRSSESDSEESFVMLFDMTNPVGGIDVCPTRSMISSVFANQRCRQISECSDDSIVFCYESDGEDSAHQPDHAYDDEDYSEEEGTDEEDSCDEDSEDTLSHQPDSGFEEKKVQFNLKPVVHVMRTWDFAYRQARKGEWEMAARDRERFKKRIKETEIILCPVFDQNLRDKVYRERFC